MKKTKARNEAAPGREGAGGIVGRKVEAHRCSPILSGYKVTGATSDIDPIHKGMSLFLSYTNMNTINSLYHVKEHPKISNFLKFESHSSNSFKVKAI